MKGLPRTQAEDKQTDSERSQGLKQSTILQSAWILPTQPSCVPRCVHVNKEKSKLPWLPRASVQTLRLHRQEVSAAFKGRMAQLWQWRGGWKNNGKGSEDGQGNFISKYQEMMSNLLRRERVKGCCPSTAFCQTAVSLFRTPDVCFQSPVVCKNEVHLSLLTYRKENFGPECRKMALLIETQIAPVGNQCCRGHLQRSAKFDSQDVICHVQALSSVSIRQEWRHI